MARACENEISENPGVSRVVPRIQADLSAIKLRDSKKRSRPSNFDQKDGELPMATETEKVVFDVV